MTLSIDQDQGTPAEEPSHEPSAEAPDNRVRNAAIGIAAVAALLALLAVFASGNDTAAPDWRGRILPTPQQQPDIRLTSTDGAPFSLINDSPGDLTLLMFGYTNCPDICPISLGTLEASLEALGPDVANRVNMVFVTADPKRDTPEVLRDYLDGYSTNFIGLRGTADEVTQAQTMADVPVAQLETPDDDGEYAVGHATQMIAYQDDGVARIVYPFGTRSEDWEADLPRLLAGEHPSE